MKATICVDVDSSAEKEIVDRWFATWRAQLAYCSENNGCGCCVNMWDVDGPDDAIAQLPQAVVTSSEWTRGTRKSLSPLDRIQEKLRSHPNALIERGDSFIVVRPSTPTGFAARLDVSSEHFTVSFEGWHEQFTDTSEAIRCFGFGLSPLCRLKVTCRGVMPVKWTVQSYDGKEWNDDSTTGLLFVPFWRAERIEYFSNSLLRPLPNTD